MLCCQLAFAQRKPVKIDYQVIVDLCFISGFDAQVLCVPQASRPPDRCDQRPPLRHQCLCTFFLSPSWWASVLSSCQSLSSTSVSRTTGGRGGTGYQSRRSKSCPSTSSNRSVNFSKLFRSALWLALVYILVVFFKVDNNRFWFLHQDVLVLLSVKSSTGWFKYSSADFLNLTTDLRKEFLYKGSLSKLSRERLPSLPSKSCALVFQEATILNSV